MSSNDKWADSGSTSTQGARCVHYLATAVDKDGTRYLAAGASGGLVLLKASAQNPEQFESVALRLRTRPEYILLEDLDGDGWLDLAAALVGGAAAPDVVFGPLWDNFSALAQQAR